MWSVQWSACNVSMLHVRKIWPLVREIYLVRFLSVFHTSTDRADPKRGGFYAFHVDLFLFATYSHSSLGSFSVQAIGVPTTGLAP